MPTRSHSKILHQVLALPTAPFRENEVAEHIRSFCSTRKGLRLSVDKHGNLLVHLKRGRRRTARPACITAHMDHPGFISKGMTGEKTLAAKWYGGVKPEYFDGTKVRFLVDGGWVKGRIESSRVVTAAGRKKVEDVTVSVASSVPSGSIGMWDLPSPRIRGSRIEAPVCDDLAGVAAILCSIDTLCRQKGDCEAYFLFTRAEEVGFVGAMAAVKAGTIPEKCYVVCTETSSELPHAKMGDGPVLRVGDRETTFTSEVTSFCGRLASGLASRSKSFAFQRRLMDGGMCEATAYCHLGHESTCICLSLGNYHNMNVKRGKIAPEYVDLKDFDNLVKWFVELASTKEQYTGKETSLSKTLAGVRKTHRSLLKSTAKSFE